MKTIFTLFASLFMSIAVFAAKNNTILTIKSADQADISVVLDGKRFSPNDNSVMIQGLENGSHYVKVYRAMNNGIFNVFGRRYELVYDAAVSMKNNRHLFITIERNGRVSMMENKIKKGYVQNDDRWYDAGNGYDYNRDGQWGDYDNHEAYARGMDDREFDNVLKQIDKEWLESNKLKSALQIVKANTVSAAQVKELLLLFSFENNKLELAKQAYASTVDKKNYDMVFDVFSFNNSKTELSRYIRNYR